VGAFVRFFQRHYYMVLSDRRVIFCGLSYWTARPRNIKVVVPRGQVQVSDYKPGTVWPSFRIGYPGRNKPMKLRAHRAYRPEVEQILGALGFGGGPQPGLAGYAPGQVAGAGYQTGAELPPPGYAPQQYQAPPPGYQPAPQQYQASPPQYQPAPQQYQPAPQYDAPTQQFQAVQEEYDAPTRKVQPAPQQYQAPQQQPGYPPVPPPGTGRGRHAGG
jgi:hypothetical protein